MSAHGLKVLDYLFEAKSNDWPFVPLPNVHARTLKALFEADLIAKSPGDDGIRSGRVEGYCLTCANKSKRRAYRLKRPQHCPDRLCSRCHKRKVHVSSGGRVLTYCLPCKNLRNRRRKKQDHKRDLKRVRSGEVLLCTRPGCTRPRHTTPSCVYVWCREHYREWYNAYRRAKKIGHEPGRIGRPRKVEVQP